MTVRHSFLLVLALNLVSFANGWSQDLLLGNNKRALQGKTKLTHTIDERIAVTYVATGQMDESTMTSYLSFDGKVVQTHIFADLSLFEEPCDLITSGADSVALDSLQSHMVRTHGLQLTTTHPINSIVYLKESFGLACGSSGIPRGHGSDFLTLAHSGPSEEHLVELLTSINPVHQMFGYLLLRDSKDPNIQKYLPVVKHSHFEIDFCEGCTGRERLTVADLIRHLADTSFDE